MVGSASDDVLGFSCSREGQKIGFVGWYEMSIVVGRWGESKSSLGEEAGLLGEDIRAGPLIIISSCALRLSCKLAMLQCYPQ